MRHLVVVVVRLLALGAALPRVAVAAELRAAARACPPAASVEGPAEIVGPLVAILRGHGVGMASSVCDARIVKAPLVVVSGAGGYRLHVLDGEGHSSEREVASAAVAASLIESWALDEDAELWAPRPGSAATETVASLPPEAQREVPRSARVGVAAETSLSPDAAFWRGAGASGCVSVRALCVGARAAVSRAETTLEIDRALGIAPDLTRTLGGLSAFGAWPIALGRFWVAPSLGLGAAWLHSHATQAGVTSTSDDVVARAEAGGQACLTLGKGLSIALGLGGSALLVVRGDDRQGTTTYIPAVPRGFLTAGASLWYAP